MSEFSKGFDEGFATALRHADKARLGDSVAAGFDSGGAKKISIGFRADQFEFIKSETKKLNCSFAQAVRTIIDRA